VVMPAKNMVVRQVEIQQGRVFEVVTGDLLAEKTDTIVNAANSNLAHGGGVALAIARAAGISLVEESNRIVREHGPVPVGEAVITTSGHLPFKGITHTVGPRMGEGDEHPKLVKALFNTFLRAHEKSWESVSFPGVSSGIFAVPHALCARAYVEAVGNFWRDHADSTVRLIRLVLFEGPLLDEVLGVIQHRDQMS
jgi:O-acetyl-ADP-ribose deacetylase (regulator of RNase III)